MSKKIVIVGTGFSSLIASIIVISKGYKPIVLDCSSNIHHKKIYTKKNYLKYNFFFGGLSNFWGGAINKVGDFDKKNPLNTKILSKYYSFVDQLFDQLGKNDNYSSYFKLNKNIINNKQSNLSFLKKKNFIIGSSRIAISKKKPFKANSIFLKLYRSKKLILDKNFKVKKFIETKNKVKLYSYTKKQIICDKVFLGSGPYGSAKIIMNSLKEIKKVCIKENTINFGIMLLREKVSFKNNNPFCDFFITKINNENYHNQIYYPKSKFLKKLKKNYIYYFLFQILNKLFKDRVIIIFNYMNMNNSKEYIIRKYGASNIIVNKLSIKNYLKTVKKDLKKIFENYKPFFIFFKNSKFGESNHCGSTFPLNIKKSFKTTDNFGRLKNMKNVHLIDSSVLPTLPTNTLTYTLMANSAKITDSSLRSKKNNLKY